jgi:hypothetical protein
VSREIPPERQFAYYLGAVIMVIGGLVFVSTFFTGFSHPPDFGDMQHGMQSTMTTALVGMGLLVLGGIIRGIGARGLAGSGVVLDPEKAREELEPYSRMAGGMVKDALDQADVHLGAPPTQLVMIKCPSCATLNTEDAKFCKECGKKL